MEDMNFKTIKIPNLELFFLGSISYDLFFRDLKDHWVMEDMNFKTIKILNLELDLNLWVEKVGKQGKIPLKPDPIPVLPVKSHLDLTECLDFLWDFLENKGKRIHLPGKKISIYDF